MRLTLSTIFFFSLSSSTVAWAPSSVTTRSTGFLSQQQQQRVSQQQLHASVEDKVTETVTTVVPVNGATAAIKSTEPPVLSGDYLTAYEQAVEKMSAKIPEVFHSKMLPLLSHFLKEYLTAAQVAHAENPDDDFTLPIPTMERFVKGAALGLQYGVPTSPDFYTFDVTHTGLRGEEIGYGRTDFYAYGNNFFRHCMDFNKEDPVGTHVLGFDNLQKALDQANAGENVVFLANHQSEADPQVVSICFEKAGEQFSEAASKMLYVAGHKVTTDALAIPFSMGRNLICIHSKKHIDADKETKPFKQRQNLKAMNGLLRKLKQGGTMVWVAPSGGRDRRDLTTGEVPIAPFDSKTIDMFRLMGNKSGKPTHYYTMAMVSYELCPPPDTVEAGTGEQRNVRYSPVGIKIGNELLSIGGLESRHDFCDTAMQQCEQDYNELHNSLNQYLASKQQQQK